MAEFHLATILDANREHSDKEWRGFAMIAKRSGGFRVRRRDRVYH
jgi:hypothetical protein